MPEAVVQTAALAPLEAQCRALGGALPFGDWSADRGGRLLHVAPAFLELLGTDLEACREGWAERVHPEDRDSFVAAWQRGFGGSAGFDVEYRVTDVRGEHRPVLLRAIPVAEQRGVAWVGLNLDVGEKRRLENELVHLGRLQSVALLVGGVAHDFNNLLTSILGNVALARLAAKGEEGVLRRLEAAERAGQQAQALSRQLLALAKGGAPVRTEVSLAPILRDSAEFALQGRAVRCDYHLPDGLRTVAGDPTQLSQLVQNLVLNGAEAMEGEGVITIRADNVEVRYDSPIPLKSGAYVRVEVTDRRPGIAPEDLPRVFEPQPSASTPGGGMALAVAQMIVKRHGGHLAVRSVPGDQTTFTVYLPASGAAVAAPAIARAAGHRGRGRILVMDDDAQVRAVAYLSLVRMGYRVTLAAHGFQAIEMYRTAMREEQPYQAVFLDLTIPGGMGGTETFERLREIDPGVKAVVATGYTNAPILREYASQGLAGAITKPYTVDDLGRVLQEVLAAPPRRAGESG
jgi:two-component system cell cycle sensor histidine kinase/response regulator CckA